jgi:Na+/H+ antiporter NhaD/arsenite permease-like protein
MTLLLASATPDPNPLFILPFGLLLLCIATLPLFFGKFWEHYYRHIAVGLGLVSAGYYVLGLQAGERLLHVAGEYVSFIVFIGSLFVVAGGIHIRVKGESTPVVNVCFLLCGAVVANLFGTTGASMLLIRPWIRSNKYRYTGLHTCFFIFVVSNVGGCLTPIGDPPLFLGYLKGVPFFWITRHAILPWLLAVGLILAIFYFVDRHNFNRAPKAVRDLETGHEEWKFDGFSNFLYLAAILAAVIFLPPGWREAVMVLAAAGSYRTTPQPVHDSNHFTFGPIKEVAWLFLGIFATMVPALDYLQLHAAQLGIREPVHFYWLSGALSGVLDNAPTYLTFLAAALGLQGANIDDPASVAAFLTTHAPHVVAVSLGAVFFGAMTYIGNGPNFMVKAIADQAGVHSPTFPAYALKFSFPVLLPVFAIVALVFF